MEIKDIKSFLPRNKAILGFDYGEKRLGVAVSDLLLMTANPLPIIPRKDIKKDIEKIEQIITDREVGLLVFGLPLQMNGQEGETAIATKKFAETVSQKTSLPYCFWDERLSSKAVETFLINEIDMSRAKRKQILDSSAAAYILQGVLDAIRYL